MSGLVVENVTKQFTTRAEPLTVLAGVSLQLATGENLAILGPSGCGKSTLLHILGTLDSPSSGRVTLDGQNPFELAEPQLADFRNRCIGFVFQDHHLLPQCSVLENVLLPTLAGKSSASDVAARAKQLLDRVGLAARLDHRPAELSGGERQRAAIARALILQPKLLLADEPTGNLDRTTAEVIGQMLLDLQRQDGFTLVVVTHSAELARSLNRRMELDLGKLKNAA